MPVSAGIYNALMQPVKSVADYAADYDQADIRKQGIQRNALMMQEAQAAMADRERARREGETLRNALSTLGAGATPEQRIGAMEGTGLPQGFTQADALRKALAEQQRAAAQAEKDRAATELDRFKLTRQKLEHGVMGLQVAQTPQQAAQMFADGVQKGYWGMQEAQQQAQGIPQDPAQFQMWKRTQLAQILDAAKLIPVQVSEDQGATRMFGTRDPLTGALTQNASVPITQSENNRATVGASIANANATREVANATRDAAKITARAGDETALRKEFADLPEVKKYKNAIPAYQAIVKAAAVNNPQADINLIYGLAKLYDPDSVVREGEYDTIANSQSIPEWLKGQAQRLQGGGKLSPETKKQILEQAKIRVGAYQSEVDGARSSFDKIARGRGLDPANVFPAIGGQIDAAPAAAPKPGTVEDGYRFKGGNPKDKANWEKV